MAAVVEIGWRRSALPWRRRLRAHCSQPSAASLRLRQSPMCATSPLARCRALHSVGAERRSKELLQSMCGIVGIVGKTDVAQRLFDGLKRLEYRGYDSAGICTIDDGKLDAAPGRGQARQSRARADGRSAPRDHRHRPHALGDAWRADGRQCPPAHRRAGGAGPQRDHREFQAAARRTDRRGAQVRERDRHRGRRRISSRARSSAAPRRRTRSRRCCRGCTARSPSRSCSATIPT